MLGYILVGNNMDSELYVKMKKKACDSLGIGYHGFHLNSNVQQDELNDAVRSLQ